MCKNFEWGVSYPYQTWKCTNKHTWRPPWGCAFNDQINWPGMHRGWLLGASSECTPSSQTCCPQQAAWCILMAQLVAGGLLLNFNLLYTVLSHRPVVCQSSGTGAVFSTWPAEQRVSQRNGARAHAFKPSTAVLLKCCGESTVWFHQELRKSPVTETNSLYIYCRQMPFSFGCAYILVAGWFCTTARVDPCI